MQWKTSFYMMVHNMPAAVLKVTSADILATSFNIFRMLYILVT